MWPHRMRSGAVAVALIVAGGLVAPVVTAGPAQAATIARSDANCNAGASTGSAITGAPGDVVTITANLANCDTVNVRKSVVDDSTAIVTAGGNITLIPDLYYWVFQSDDSFTQVQVTLGSSNVAEAPGLVLENSMALHYTEWDVTITGSPTPPTPPTPDPVYPPLAPTAAEATPGDHSATVSWTEPSSPGSFAVSNYQVQSTVGNYGCLVPATTTSCTISGLTNGATYTFRVRALNGAGWGSWADAGAVTPGPDPVARTIVITGSRANQGREARVSGQTTGLVGAQLQSHVRLTGDSDFADGSLAAVGAQGAFSWQRRVNPQKTVEVYFAEGDVTSNTVTIAAD